MNITRKKGGIQLHLITFEYQDQHPFRTLEIDGEPWFVLADVCRVLEIGNPAQAATRLDEDEKSTIISSDSGNLNDLRIIVNESGLWSLVLTSRKPESKRFKRWITKEVLPSIRKTGGYGIAHVPAFIKRFNDNWDRVDKGYFSIISELVIRVHGKLEHLGYHMPDKTAAGIELRPDVSVGILFPKWLATRPDYLDIFRRRKRYEHLLPDGKVIEAWQYPVDALPLFIEFIDDEWMPNRSFDYFRDRDPNALEYLPLALPAPKEEPKVNRKRSA